MNSCFLFPSYLDHSKFFFMDIIFYPNKQRKKRGKKTELVFCIDKKMLFNILHNFFFFRIFFSFFISFWWVQNAMIIQRIGEKVLRTTSVKQLGWFLPSGKSHGTGNVPYKSLNFPRYFKPIGQNFRPYPLPIFILLYSSSANRWSLNFCFCYLV